MADHPLRSATHRCLGRPLPHQLANGTRTHLYAIACRQRPSFPPAIKSGAYPVLAAVSSCYPRLKGRLSTRYSPVRHSTRGRSHFRVRLACVKHAASVQSEPESNSPVQICTKIPAWQKSESQSSISTRSSLVNEPEKEFFTPAVFCGVCKHALLSPLCQQLFWKSSKNFL